MEQAVVVQDSIANQAWFPFLLMITEFFLGAALAFLVYLFKQVNNSKLELLAYKLEVSQTYAKDSEIKELLHSLDRKLDQVIRDVHHN